MSKYYPPVPPVDRSPSNHTSYSPGHWKNYVVKEFDHKYKDIKASRHSQSQRAMSPQNSLSHIIYEPVHEGFDEKQRKKEEMMKRDKEIQ